MSVVFGFARSLLIFHVLVRSSQSLHNAMFDAVIRTPVRFFDVNPVGVSWLHRPSPPPPPLQPFL